MWRSAQASPQSSTFSCQVEANGLCPLHHRIYCTTKLLHTPQNVKRFERKSKSTVEPSHFCTACCACSRRQTPAQQPVASFFTHAQGAESGSRHVSARLGTSRVRPPNHAAVWVEHSLGCCASGLCCHTRASSAPDLEPGHDNRSSRGLQRWLARRVLLQKWDRRRRQQVRVLFPCWFRVQVQCVSSPHLIDNVCRTGGSLRFKGGGGAGIQPLVKVVSLVPHTL